MTLKDRITRHKDGEKKGTRSHRSSRCREQKDWVERRVEEEAGMTFRVMDKIQVGARSAPTYFSASDSEADGVPPLHSWHV